MERRWRDLIKEITDNLNSCIASAVRMQRMREWIAMFNAFLWLESAAVNFYRLKYSMAWFDVAVTMLLVCAFWWFIGRAIRSIRSNKVEFAKMKLECQAELQKIIDHKERGFE